MARHPYCITDGHYEANELRAAFQNAKQTLPEINWEDLNCIFEIALQSINLFPNIKFSGEQNNEHYIAQWVKKYHESFINPPSTRQAEPKSSCSDPSITNIVKIIKEIPEEDNDEIQTYEKIHNLFMSAENVQGNLLEEYISQNVRPYGFIWCQGTVLKSIDFCNTSGTLLLQIKNRSNTENSSSLRVRDGTTIEKWYRLGTRSIHHVKTPTYKWDKLNSLIDHFQTLDNDQPCSMCEEDYQAFLTRIARSNHSLITDL
jgi:hypothetical protein